MKDLRAVDRVHEPIISSYENSQLTVVNIFVVTKLMELVVHGIPNERSKISTGQRT